jgi:predicted PurR-regulated permease PerM
METNPLVRKATTIFSIIALFLLGLFLLKPIIISVILGLLVAYLFYPIYKKLNKKLNKPNLSAIILIFSIIVLITIPLVYIIPTIITQALGFYTSFQGVDLVTPIKHFLPSTLQDSNALSANLNNIVAQAFNSLINQFGNFLVNLPSFLLQFIVFLFIFYFSIMDSKKLKDYFISLSPFSPSTEKRFLEEFRKITDAIVYGQFLIGLLQGVALGAMLLILGVPNFLILTVLAIILSVIPLLGAWFVWGPVAFFLFIAGSPIKAVILIVYGVFIGTIDNFLRPYFLSKGSHLPIAIGLIGIIAGLYTFGIAGLILGPLIFAYILIILDFYREGKLSDLFKKE